jgi:nucleotide-binding universal stress UspA family protein
MSQTILCPTDLTVNSKDGVAYGLSLAKKNDAQLIIFHATSYPSLNQFPGCELEPFYPWEQLVSKFKLDHVLAEAECKVRKFVCEQLAVESNGIAWKPRVALGRVSEEIVAAAVREEVDLIVLSRRKVRSLTRLFTRSISETVSRDAPCPVLSIDASQIVRSSPVWRVPFLRETVESS